MRPNPSLTTDPLLNCHPSPPPTGLRGDFGGAFRPSHHGWQSLYVYLFTLLNSSANHMYCSQPETPERGGPCWQLKLRQMGTHGVQRKGVPPWVVSLSLSCRYKRFYPALTAIVSPVQNKFPHCTLFHCICQPECSCAGSPVSYYVSLVAALVHKVNDRLGLHILTYRQTPNFPLFLHWRTLWQVVLNRGTKNTTLPSICEKERVAHCHLYYWWRHSTEAYSSYIQGAWN